MFQLEYKRAIIQVIGIIHNVYYFLFFSFNDKVMELT